MSDPFLGEVRMFGGTFAPVGWAMCSGQTLPISQNDALYNLLGTTYGGDGVQTFGIPDLRGRAPVHTGNPPGMQNYVLGATGGLETVTLTASTMAPHTHAVTATANVGNSPEPTAKLFGQATQIKVYTQDTASKFFAPGIVSSAGGSQPHDNMQPFTAVTFIIALAGIYPTQG